jgi:hypothetical protein
MAAAEVGQVHVCVRVHVHVYMYVYVCTRVTVGDAPVLNAALHAQH